MALLAPCSEMGLLGVCNLTSCIVLLVDAVVAREGNTEHPLVSHQ